EIELDLDLQLLPAWARQPQTTNRYADFEDRGGDADRRGPRSRGPGGPGGPGGFGGPRREGRGDRRPDFRGPRPGGPGGPGGGPGAGHGSGPGGRPVEGRPPRRDERGKGPRRFDRDRGPERREPVEEPLPEGVTVEFIPDPAGIDSLTRQIRQTGRA